MLEIGATHEVGALAVRLPKAAKVFLDHGIEFCCAGPRSLRSACSARGANVERIIEEIEIAAYDQYRLQPADDSLVALVDFIVDGYLRPLRIELATVESLLEKTLYAHGVGEQRTRQGLSAAFSNLSLPLWEHLQQKEDVLYPAILSGDGRAAKRAFRTMRQQHATLAERLEILHRLTAGFATPNRLCVAERTLMTSLRELTTDLATQFHMEHNLLYSRAIRE